MKLSELVELIEREAELSRQIDNEIDLWTKGALRMAVKSFGAGSLRKSAERLGVSPTYLSHCCSGKLQPSRRLMQKLHATFGVGEKGLNP